MNAINVFAGNADLFPVLKQWHFFNHAGVAPLPRAASDAIRLYSVQAESAAYLGAGWYYDIEKLRQESAALIHCHRDEIAFVKNTSEGISIVANGIDWQFGDRVVTTNIEYPANIYPWMEVARTRGVKLVMVPEQPGPDHTRMVPVEKILAAAAEPRTRLVSLSHVEFASGQRHDLARIGQFCSERNILFCVDAIQSLGVLPLNVADMYIDFLSADGHKWLLGPEGAGIFFCRRALIERTRPLMIGWMNVIDSQNFGSYDFTLQPDASRFECGSHNVGGLLALHRASLQLIQSIGIAAISDRIKALTDQLINGLKLKGYHVISPRLGEEWSGIVSFASPTFSHETIFQELRTKHVEVAPREGRLRCSPHFYNTEAQMHHLVDLLPGH